MSRLTRAAFAVLGVAALGAATAATATAAPSKSHALPGSVPAWANAAHRAGSTSASTSVTFRVYLDYSDPAGAAAYATAVATKGSPDYGHFLSPAQFRARFAPSASSVTAVKSWLRSQGFHVGTVPSNRKYVEATGSLGQAAAAFDTSFATFHVEGRTVRSNTTPLTVPSSLTGVEGVVGLDESQTLAHSDKTTPPPPVFVNGKPCSDFWGQKTVTNTATADGTALPDTPSAFAPCGYAGAQLQGAYGLKSAIDGGNDG